MAIRGKVCTIGQLQSGVSKTKGTPWKKQEFVIETEGQYPKKVAFSMMNDKIDNANIQMGQTIEIEVDAQSREYNGRWYTELTAWRVNNLGFTAAPQQQAVYQQQAPQGYQQPTYPQQQAPQQGGYANFNGNDVAF
jgi:hypothetical protein